VARHLAGALRDDVHQLVQHGGKQDAAEEAEGRIPKPSQMNSGQYHLEPS
jgi:hypothetical protein